jgi:hypothetical protein
MIPPEECEKRSRGDSFEKSGKMEDAARAIKIVAAKLWR